MTEQQAVEIISEIDFDLAWKVCKAHKQFKGLAKRMIEQYRPGYVYMKLLDLYHAKLLTAKQKAELGIADGLKIPNTWV